MTNAELIEKLKQLDPNLPVYVGSCEIYAAGEPREKQILTEEAYKRVTAENLKDLAGLPRMPVVEIVPQSVRDSEVK